MTLTEVQTSSSKGTTVYCFLLLVLFHDVRRNTPHLHRMLLFYFRRHIHRHTRHKSILNNVAVWERRILWMGHCHHLTTVLHLVIHIIHIFERLCFQFYLVDVIGKPNAAGGPQYVRITDGEDIQIASGWNACPWRFGDRILEPRRCPVLEKRIVWKNQQVVKRKAIGEEIVWRMEPREPEWWSPSISH